MQAAALFPVKQVPKQDSNFGIAPAQVMYPDQRVYTLCYSGSEILRSDQLLFDWLICRGNCIAKEWHLA